MNKHKKILRIKNKINKYKKIKTLKKIKLKTNLHSYSNSNNILYLIVKQ